MSRPMAQKQTTGYDRYINWKLFCIPLGLFLTLLLIPTPKSMLRVGAEYALGPEAVRDLLAEEVFGKPCDQLIQWEVLFVRMAEASVGSSSFGRGRFLSRDRDWCGKNGLSVGEGDLSRIRERAESIPSERFTGILKSAHELRTRGLRIDEMNPRDRARVEKAGSLVKVAVALMVFVVGCFLTEAIPLPMVAFCIGIIALLSGIVDRERVASLYWSDATWFIMGSLMFAAAFVKTGVDRRIAVMMFGWLRRPTAKWITFILLLVISPLTMFMSDHALAAMVMPIGILLYTTATAACGSEDPELGKMIMITIAMACNLGGSLAPSGAARNIIMMSYSEDMFGVSIGFGQWCLYCVPYLVLVVPITWLVINWRFRPKIRDLAPGIAAVREEIRRGGGGWTGKQKASVAIFAVMLFCWITEKNLIHDLIGIRLGIGVIAVMGALAYILAGIVNWRDYQTRVDWGVVWLYAGAIIFGKVLVVTGGAYWLASSFLSLVGPLGLGEGPGLLFSSSAMTGILTQLMADGPACAAVGPVTLSMAGIVHPGSCMIPFVAMSTAIASSLAYCLVIGTPPNAIVYASGLVGQRDYLRAGVILFVTNLAALMLLALVYWFAIGFPGLQPV